MSVSPVSDQLYQQQRGSDNIYRQLNDRFGATGGGNRGEGGLQRLTLIIRHKKTLGDTTD